MAYTIFHKIKRRAKGVLCYILNDDRCIPVLLSLALVLGFEMWLRTYFEFLALALRVKSLALVLLVKFLLTTLLYTETF